MRERIKERISNRDIDVVLKCAGGYLFEEISDIHGFSKVRARQIYEEVAAIAAKYGYTFPKKRELNKKGFSGVKPVIDFLYRYTSDNDV